MKNNDSSRRIWVLSRLALLMVGVIWGSSLVVVKSAVSHIPPSTLIAVRFTLAFLTLAIVFHRHLRRIKVGDLWRGAVMGACLSIAYMIQTIGVTLAMSCACPYRWFSGRCRFIFEFNNGVPGSAGRTLALPARCLVPAAGTIKNSLRFHPVSFLGLNKKQLHRRAPSSVFFDILPFAEVRLPPRSIKNHIPQESLCMQYAPSDIPILLF